MSERQRPNDAKIKPVDPQPGPEPAAVTPPQLPGERGGPKGPEPTRFGDWEKNGRCFDF